MRISCLQMDMLPGKPEENFAHAVALVRKAAAERPDVVLLPETWNSGFDPGFIGPESADPDGTRTKETFSFLARELHINLLAGSVMRLSGARLYNTAYAFGRDGSLLAAYDKTHLFSPMGEDKHFEKGDHTACFSFDGAKCGVIICYDIRFPELTRTMALSGLDVLFVVSQWPRIRIPHLETLMRARAIENQMFTVLCNSCGQSRETRYGGHSAIVDPLGGTVAEAGETETILTAEVNLAAIQAVRGRIPVFNDRRPELYASDNKQCF